MIGAGAKGGVEAASEGARTHEGAGGHMLNGEFFVQMGGHPGEGCAEGFGLVGADQRRFDILGLVAVALGRDDHATGDGGSDVGAVVLADDMERKIDGGRGSGRGEYLAVVDVKDARVDLDIGITGGEFSSPAPMGGDAAAIEQASFGEDECTSAEGEDARAALIGAAQGTEHGRGNRHDAGARARDDDGVGFGDLRERAGGGEQQAREGADGSRLGGAEQEAIPGDAEFGAFDAKDFGGDAEFERIDVIVDDGGDGVRVRFLLLRVFSATGNVALFMAGL